MDKFIYGDIPKSWKNYTSSNNITDIKELVIIQNQETIKKNADEIISLKEQLDNNDNDIIKDECLNDIMLEELQLFKFPLNRSRMNVMNFPGENIYGFCLGLVWWHYGGHRLETCRRLQKWKKYQKIWETTNSYMKHFKPDFKYSSVQYNKNIKCAKHKDGNNIGNSLIISFGNFTGGRLMVYDENDKVEYIDIKNKFYEFNGSKVYHQTEDFEGERFSLVFFLLEDNRIKK